MLQYPSLQAKQRQPETRLALAVDRLPGSHLSGLTSDKAVTTPLPSAVDGHCPRFAFVSFRGVFLELSAAALSRRAVASTGGPLKDSGLLVSPKRRWLLQPVNIEALPTPASVV